MHLNNFNFVVFILIDSTNSSLFFLAHQLTARAI